MFANGSNAEMQVNFISVKIFIDKIWMLLWILKIWEMWIFLELCAPNIRKDLSDSVRLVEDKINVIALLVIPASNILDWRHNPKKKEKIHCDKIQKKAHQKYFIMW